MRCTEITIISEGVMAPLPALRVTRSRALDDSKVCGIAVRELGVTCKERSGMRAIATATRDPRKMESGRRCMTRVNREKKFREP
jgi:hypothetical protein